MKKDIHENCIDKHRVLKAFEELIDSCTDSINDEIIVDRLRDKIKELDL